MAGFCNQCGRPLKDGEVCNCTASSAPKVEENRQQDVGAAPQSTNNSYTANDSDDVLKNVSNSIGKMLDSIYYTVTPKDSSTNKSSAIALRKLLTFSQEDYMKPLDNVYERGARLTPDLIQPCSDEIIIRQYDVCTVRSALKGLWQDGRLLVTNKRIVFRLSGRNWLGKEQTSKEFDIDDIAGVDMSYSSKINFGAILINALIATIPASIASILGFGIPMLGSILGILLYVFFLVFLRGHHTFKSIIFFVALALISAAPEAFGEFGNVILIAGTLITVIHFYLASLRPSFSFKVLTKSATAAPISAEKMPGIFSALSGGITGSILPGKDADRAMDELGAMINDIQKYGDYGVNKWKAL